MPTKKTYTLTEAARKLGISRAAVHKAVKLGRLQSYTGTIRRQFIRESALLKFKKSRQAAGKKQTKG